MQTAQRSLEQKGHQLIAEWVVGWLRNSIHSDIGSAPLCFSVYVVFFLRGLDGDDIKCYPGGAKTRTIADGRHPRRSSSSAIHCVSPSDVISLRHIGCKSGRRRRKADFVERPIPAVCPRRRTFDAANWRHLGELSRARRWFCRSSSSIAAEATSLTLRSTWVVVSSWRPSSMFAARPATFKQQLWSTDQLLMVPLRFLCESRMSRSNGNLRSSVTGKWSLHIESCQFRSCLTSTRHTPSIIAYYYDCVLLHFENLYSPHMVEFTVTHSLMKLFQTGSATVEFFFTSCQSVIK